MKELPLTQAIELFFEKHIALREGNLEKLIQLRQDYPLIFDKIKDKEIRDLILYAKKFEASPQYKALKKLVVKDSLKLVT